MFNSSRGLDEKLSGVLLAAWSVLLAVATVSTFCGEVKVAPSAATQVAQHAPANTAQPKVVVAQR